MKGWEARRDEKNEISSEIEQNSDRSESYRCKVTHIVPSVPPSDVEVDLEVMRKEQRRVNNDEREERKICCSPS